MTELHNRVSLFATLVTPQKKRNQARDVVSLDILPGMPTLEHDSIRAWWVEDNRSDNDNIPVNHELSRTHILTAGVACLRQGDPHKKATQTLQFAQAWRDNRLSAGPLLMANFADAIEYQAPDTPSRLVRTVAPEDAPRRGKGASAENRLKLIHSLAHIESVAIDLGWDMVCRFGFSNHKSIERENDGEHAETPIEHVKVEQQKQQQQRDLVMPRAFLDDWITVAEDEARHFLMWSNRLQSLDSFYGALDTHSGLWDSARDTAGDVLARLAVEHMTLEARGLDVAPLTFNKFSGAGDRESAEMLKAIYAEEVTHVAAGMKWFTFETKRRGLNTPDQEMDEFHKQINVHFTGKLKRPFNVDARSAAGMTPGFYLPLSA